MPNLAESVRAFGGADALMSCSIDCMFKNPARLNPAVCNHRVGQFSGQATWKCPRSPDGQSITGCGPALDVRVVKIFIDQGLRTPPG